MPGSASRDVLAALRLSPVFAALSERDLDALAAAAREERCRARAYVFREGDPARWLCLVKAGHVRIVRHSRTGKDVILEILGPGEIFGGVAVIERRPYPASAQATEPAVVIKVPAEALAAVTQRDASVVRAMALMMGRRLRDAHDSIRSLAIEPVEARLAATLLRLAGREGVRTARGLELPFPLTRQSLADMSGTTVETTIRVMSRWLRVGLVEDQAGHLVVRDGDALRRLAGTEAPS